MGNEREYTLPNIESYYKSISWEAGTEINRSILVKYVHLIG